MEMVKGGAQFVKMLKRLPDTTKQPIWDALELGASEVLGFMGVEWWVGDFKGWWIENGIEAGSKVITVKRNGKKFKKTVTWVAQPPQPFFWASYRVYRRRMRARVGRVMKQTLIKNFII